MAGVENKKHLIIWHIGKSVTYTQEDLPVSLVWPDLLAANTQLDVRPGENHN